jgi:hypothetical protein
MDEINNALNKFIQSIDNKNDINTINNNLSLLIARMNIFYYKNNFFNNSTNCNETNINVTLAELEKIAEEIRNIYPKFMDLKKENFRNVYINKLNCNKTPGDLLKNIDKSNKIQSIITDLSDLLYFKTSDVPEIVLSKNNNTTNSESNNSLLLYIAIIIGVILIGLVIFLIFRSGKKSKSQSITQPISQPVFQQSNMSDIGMNTGINSGMSNMNGNMNGNMNSGMSNMNGNMSSQKNMPM